LKVIALIAINPARQFAQARNSQRESNVNTILNAIGQDLADNKGVFTCSGIGTAITSATTSIGSASGNSDLTCLVGTYIPGGMPMDPSTGTVGNTGYALSVSASGAGSGRYTICADGHAESAIPGSTSYCLIR